MKLPLNQGFYINLPPTGLAILVLLFLRVPEQIPKKSVLQNFMPLLRELDIVGFVLFAPACIMFLLAVNWGGTTYPWDSATVIGLLCGSFVTICIFAVWQWHRGDRAMIPPTIIGNQLVLFGCLVTVFQMGALILLSYYLPLWFQVVKDADPTMSGVMSLPSALSQALGSVVAGKVGSSRLMSFLSAAMLISDSSNDQTLHPMGIIWKCAERHWCGSNVYILSLDWRRKLDRVSNFDRYRPRVRVANGTY